MEDILDCSTCWMGKYELSAGLCGNRFIYFPLEQWTEDVAAMAGEVRTFLTQLQTLIYELLAR